MCGITASIALNRRQTRPPSPVARAALTSSLTKSLTLLSHRGPDAHGIWTTRSASIGLAHNRLAINDLSPLATQPHHSPCNQIHALVNGEIYDDAADTLRTRLEKEHGYVFTSRADTELVVALYSVYGAPEFLSHLRGEFAVVVYDERDGKVICARDRFGIKPLFWTVVEEGDGEKRLLLASEAKAFLALGWEPEWDVGAIAGGEWLVGEKTLFEGVKKVLPGCWMEVGVDGEMVQKPYWDFEYPDKREVETRSVDEMVLGVRERLTEAIRVRLRADVPVGIYLSGGIDSSLIAGIVTHLVREEGVRIGNQDATSRICCFSIEFPSDSGFNESDVAERTANHLGVRFIKKHMDEATLAENFADSVYHSEQHNMDLNSVGKHVLSTAPQENGFKVVLTGEGSDEHFAGYPFYASDYLAEPDSSMPESELSKNTELRNGLHLRLRKEFERMAHSRIVGSQPTSNDSLFQPINNVRVLGWAQAWQPSLGVFAPWAQEKWAGANCASAAINELSPEMKAKIQDKWHPLHSAQYLWSKTLMANNLLTCLNDRTDMAHGIESRPPFLDHVLSEYVNQLPPSIKLAYAPEKTNADCGGGLPGGGSGSVINLFTEKWILREAGKPFITKELYERKKLPYFAPIRWPKGGPLDRTLRKICTKEAVENLGFVDYAVVEAALDSAFGDDAKIPSFRVLLLVGSWVVIGERFGVKRARRDGVV